jgi:hypothetical protein
LARDWPARLGCLQSPDRSLTLRNDTGGRMNHTYEHARRLAQNLVELLASYEEELIALEREAPAYGPLRRAVGIVIAEACFCISDQTGAADTVVPPTDDEATRTR